MRIAAALLLVAAARAACAESLEADLGRSEERVRSAAWRIPLGRGLEESGLPERLRRQGQRRVRDKPDEPGEWFWGKDRAWIYRRACRWGGEDHEAELFGIDLRSSDGLMRAVLDDGGRTLHGDDGGIARLCPETLAESLTEDRAPRIRIPLDELPEHAWRAVLAAEDHRFFEHEGVDPRSLARAALADVLQGGAAQGGSTITQQLVKNREMTPRRTLGRKVSEAVRALSLEAEHSKEEILQAYLDSVYLGHVRGVAVHGLGAASRAWLSKDARELSLPEAALLAAMIQGPNRFAPDEHAERAKVRRDWVLGRMADLGWITEESARSAKAKPVRANLSTPPLSSARAAIAWAGELARKEAADRLDAGRGVVVETTIDPWLQWRTASIVRERLAELRRDDRQLARRPLSAAAVVLDARSGDVLAIVGGDPADREDRLDRARKARRQPGSTIKPLLLLEALDRCGDAGPLFASTRVLDEPLTVTLPGGDWSPRDADDRFRGAVTLREALVESLNVPFVRVALRCGLEPSATTLRRLGLDVPAHPPPSLALGAIEETPLQLARAYAALASGGRVPEVRAVTRIERPGGRGIRNTLTAADQVASPAAAWIVSDMMTDAVRRGTAEVAQLRGAIAAAKTGTSSERRDAWMAGHAQGIVVVTWIGLDDGGLLGFTGAQAAGPAWREIMEAALATRSPRTASSPDDLVARTVDDDGLLVPEDSPRGRTELYRRGVTPRRARWWRNDEPDPIVR